MIAWLFNNNEFCNLPESSLLFLLRLIANTADRQKPKDNINFQDLWKRIFLNQVSKLSKVKNEYAETEIQTITTVNNSEEEKGKADIVITCTVDGNDKIRICIENKVDSKEHDDQCKKYYNYFSKLDKSDGFKTIYVFLAPQNPQKELSDGGHYIKITYQDLLDAVLYPLVQYKDMLSSQSYFYLIEYINTLTSIRTNTILAMSQEYNKLLQNFYSANEDLIFAAIQAAAPEELKEQASNLHNNIHGQRKEYKITFPNGIIVKAIGYTATAREIAKYLIKNNIELSDWEKLECKKDTNKDKWFIQDKKNNKSKQIEGSNYYYNINWGEGKFQSLKDKCAAAHIIIE